MITYERLSKMALDAMMEDDKWVMDDTDSHGIIMSLHDMENCSGVFPDSVSCGNRHMMMSVTLMARPPPVSV